MNDQIPTREHTNLLSKLRKASGNSELALVCFDSITFSSVPPTISYGTCDNIGREFMSMKSCVTTTTHLDKYTPI